MKEVSVRQGKRVIGKAQLFTAVDRNYADIYLDSGEEMKGESIYKHPREVSCLWLVQGKIGTGSESSSP